MDLTGSSAIECLGSLSGLWFHVGGSLTREVPPASAMRHLALYNRVSLYCHDQHMSSPPTHPPRSIVGVISALAMTFRGRGYEHSVVFHRVQEPGRPQKSVGICGIRSRA